MKCKTAPAVEIHKGDIWRFKLRPEFEVRVVDQNDSTVSYSHEAGCICVRYRETFLEALELVRRTKRWSSAAEGKPG